MCIRDRNTPDDSDQVIGVRVVQAILVGAHEHRDRVTVSYTHLDVYKRQGMSCTSKNEIVTSTKSETTKYPLRRSR